ncbi:GPN-loop GTPase 2 isoform X1 [Hydra vulgaris]|uniref:GPN-loop GTPase 2 isoform X1 n=1 Tax=Hydra vulgaris TaxID=6087 RepID=UPI001F5FC70E|nr:GPN-loop GTPase 2-like isoform X2 [Hydra vulgaris]
MNLTTFGQVVLGPPGSGKSTYCAAIKNFLTGIGRKVIIVNLDPANDNMPFVPDICITSLVTLSDVMDLLKLGPNGGLVYCMEFLEKNFDVIEKKLKEFQGCYIIFDCPGQVELFTHQNSIKNIFQRLQKLDFRLAAVHLVDSHYCNDSAKFISVLMTSLSTMLQIELPHINVLSKIDLVEKYGKLAFSMDYFTDVMDLNYLLDIENDDVFVKKFRKLNEAMISIIQDYSLVSFSVLNVQSKESMLNLMKIIDKANGYFYGGLSEESDDVMKMMSQAVGVDLNFNENQNKNIMYED